MEEVWDYKTTKKDFEFFKDETLKWLRTYGLNDWLIEITHEAPDIEGSRATTAGTLAHKYISIKFNPKWDIMPCKIKLKEAAFHEATEVLLIRFAILADCRFATERELTEARHSIIQTLYNIMVK